MTAPPDQDKRHIWGPRAVAAVLPALLRPAFRRRSPAAAHILADWEAIVGPALAAVTVPRRLSAGVLAIGCSGPMALELQHLSDQLAARINTHLGSTAITRIRLLQERRPPAHRVDRGPPGPAAQLAAAKAVASLPSGPLRDSLERLGRRVMDRRT